MAPIVESLEMRLVPTTISLNGAGDLLIESFGTAQDMLEIRAEASGSQFVISDPGQILNTSISGANGSGTNVVQIPFSSVPNAKQLIVNTFDGDDVIRLRAIGTNLNLSPVIDAGDGSDVIETSAVVSVSTDAVDVVLNAESIRLGANLSTAGGKVSLFGDVLITNDVSITTSGISDGDVLVTGQVDSSAGPSNYTLISTPRTYSDAQLQASFDVPGGHLVTIRSASEQVDVQAVAGTSDVWIGASDSVIEGDWSWEAGPDVGVRFWSGDGITGSPVGGEYSNWQSGEPDNLDGTSEGDAAFLVGGDPSGVWRDGDVSVARAYIVEAPTLFGLTINAASGMVNFNGSVGNFLPLKSLSVTAGAMQLFGGSVSTAKAQTYNSSLNLTGPTLLRAEELNFNGGTASVTGSAGLTMAPIQRDAPINIGAGTDAGVSSFDITDSDIAAIATGFATILIGEPPPRESAGNTGPSFQSIGPVTVTSSTFSSSLLIAGGSISVTELNAGTNKVELLAANGSIIDSGDAGTDITAGDLYLDSSKGVGLVNDALETSVSAVAARAKDSGGVFVANTGNLSIGTVTAPGGIFTNAEVASVSTTGSMTVMQSIVTNGGDVTLTAASGISINGVPVETAGGQFLADADTDNDGSGTFSILSLTDFVDWTSATFGTFADGTTVSVASTTLASATAQFSANDTRFSNGGIYSPAQASGDFVETHFAGAGEQVTFSFSNPQFGLFLHFDGMQYQGTPFDPVADNPINLYSFDQAASKVSGDPSWSVDTGTNSIQQLTGDELADQDGTVRFKDAVNSLTLSRTAAGVTTSPGGDNIVNLQMGLFRAGVIMTAGGVITIRAADVDIAPNSFLNADTGVVNLIPSGTNRTIDLGGASGSGQFVVLDAELDCVTAATIQIGGANSGTITISDSISRPVTTNLNLTTGGNNGIVFSGSNATLDSNNGGVALLLNSAGTGAITSGGALKDVRGSSVSLNSGSGGIGASGNSLITDTSTLSATTGGNASMFLEEIDSLTLEPTGLSAGTGAITLTSGTFRLGNANRIDDDSLLVVGAGSTFQLNGFSESVSSLTGSGSVTNGTASVATLTVNLAGNETFSGVLGGTGSNENNFGLTKSGAGTLALSGANTYTGSTQVSAGTLLIHGSVTSNVTIASGATVGGTGTINSSNTLTVQSGGTVAPGASPGLLNSGSVSLESGSTFSVELNGTTVGTQYDQLNVTGSVTIEPNVTLSTSLGFTPSAGDALVIINNDGSDAVTGTFDSLPQGALLTLGGEKFHIFYNHNSGDGNTNDVALIANRVPVVNNQSFSISESNGNGAAVGTVAAADADSVVTFAITGGNTANVFAISASTGQITINDANGLDFETNPTFNLTVEVTDDSGAKDTATIAISVTNAAPASPTDADTAADSVSEGAANGDLVGIDAASSDIHGGTITFSLTDDAGGRFSIHPLTGVVRVADSSLLSFESAASHTITVQASDGTNASTQNFTISVTNVAPAVPSDADTAADSVSEGAANGDLVGIDADSSDVHGGAITFTLTDDAGGRFAIHPLTGVVRVADASQLDFESATSHTIIVQASDGAASTTSSFTIAVTNVAPASPSDSDTAVDSVSEGVANGDLVGVDADSSDVHGGAITFTLTADAGGRFAIHPLTGVVRVADSSLLSFESATSHTITVQASDGTNASTQDFTISVTNVAPASPTDSDTAADSVSEGTANGDTVGIDADSSDVHGGAITFSLTDDAGGRFAIHPLTGVVRVADASLLSFESATSHTIVVQASDGTASTTSSFTIAVTNVAPATPIDGDNSQNVVTERIATGDPVGIVVNSGDVHGGTIAFSLTDDAGGRFAIDGTTGVVTVADRDLFDFSTPTIHTIVVQASDGTDSSSQSFTITQVSSTLSTPIDADDHANTVPEGALEGSRVGITLFATDPDGGDVFYRLTDDSSGRFTVDPLTGVVTVKEGRLLQYAEATRYTFRAVAVNALGIPSPEKELTVNVTQVPADALPLASILPTRVSVVEGDSGPNFIEFLVKLNKPSDNTITIDFSTRRGDDPTFKRPEGITADTPFATDEPGPWDFFRSAGRLTFDSGVTEQPLRVQIRPDDVPEENELFFVQLQSPVNVRLAQQQAIATARILDDDSAPQLIVSNTQILEGDSPGQNELIFNVQLIGDLPPGVALATTDFATGNIAIDTAVAGTDYTVISGTLTFSNLDRQQQVRIPILGDSIDEADTTVSLRFTNPVGLALSRSEVVGTIINDDSTTNVVLSISPAVAKVREGNSDTKEVPFVVTLIGKPAGAVTVNYVTTDRQATAGSDYAAITGSVTFTSAEIASGVVQKLIFVTVNGDTTIEPDETFNVTLSLPTGSPAYLSINPDLAAGKVVLRNDDQAILTEDGDALALALSDDLTAILGNGPKGNPALLAALRSRALDIIRTQGLTKAIVIIIDPVDFVLTDTNGRQSGYTESTGVVNGIPGTYYSGDGTVELMIVPLPPDGSYNVQLAGLGGDFNASVTILDSNGTSTNILSQNLSDGETSSFSFQVGERATIPVGLGLASHSGAASTVGVVGAFGQFGLRLALAAGQENAERDGLDLENADARSSEWMSWLSTTVRAARRELLEPLWQTLESPLGNLWSSGLPLPDGIPAAVVDQFWSQIGQTLTGVPSGIYRLGDMLESLLPKSGPSRNRSTTPRAGEQGQPQTPPSSPGVKAKRSSLERPRSTPTNVPTGRGSNQQSSPSSKSNSIKDKSTQAEPLPPGQQQSSTPRTHWLWFAFKDEPASTKPEFRRGS